MNRMKIKEIHKSLVNGQRTQMVDQINDYGLYNFFSDYKYLLEERFYSREAEHNILTYFSDCVISYHRIMNR